MEPFERLVQNLAAKLRLDRYLSTKSQNLDKDSQRKSVERFLNLMWQHFEGEPKESETEVTVTLKLEAARSYETFSEICDELRKIGAKWRLVPHSIELLIPVTARVIDLGSYVIDLAALHADRLRDYYHKDTTKTDAAESIKFLLSCGWTEEKLCALGVSRSSFFRLRSLN